MELERHVLQRLQRAEALGQAVQPQKRWRGRGLARTAVAEAGGVALAHQPSSTLILPDRMSFLICSSLAFCSSVALQMTMSEALGPMARPKGL
ncbi:Uncharacterised protein [Xylophilus ampelinus]|nr:Uncharacterised protein [Xylophilus ampelinus]